MPDGIEGIYVRPYGDAGDLWQAVVKFSGQLPVVGIGASVYTTQEMAEERGIEFYDAATSGGNVECKNCGGDGYDKHRDTCECYLAATPPDTCDRCSGTGEKIVAGLDIGCPICRRTGLNLFSRARAQ